MNNEKFLIGCLFVLITFLISVGGVFAEDINETDTGISSSCEDINVSSCQETVLTDTLYANYQNDTLKNNDDLVANFSVDNCEGVDSLTVSFKDISDGNPDGWFWDFGDGFNSTLQNPNHTYNHIGSYNVSLKISKNEDTSIILKENLVHVYKLNNGAFNWDFESDSDILDWEFNNSSITTTNIFAKSGKKYVNLKNNGSLSQIFNFDDLKSLNFWYSSSKKNSTINIFIDDELILNYTIQNAGLGKWEEIFVDLSSFNGIHTLKFFQSSNLGFIDDIDFKFDILANFKVDSFNHTKDGLNIKFKDNSLGYISNWFWIFGDGTYSTIENPTHLFKLGNNTIKLIISNKNDSSEYTYSFSTSLPRVASTGLEYSSIQEAIDNAIDDDTIIITSCEYYNEYFENLVINKSLTLDFNNCSLIGDGVNPTITIINGSIVNLKNISSDNLILKLDDDSNIIFDNLNNKNITLQEGNFRFINEDMTNVYLTIENASVEINNCNFTNGGIIVNGGFSNIINNNFAFCDMSICQNGGKSYISRNLITNNYIGINIGGGTSNISFNSIYGNTIGLVYNSTTIVNVNNWWGTNNPVYVYNKGLVNCDVCQIGGAESGIESYLVLNITQSPNLDYDYWIVGVTYYNLTVDLTHNNHGEDTSKLGYLRNLNLTLTNINKYFYYSHHNREDNTNEDRFNVVVSSSECEIVDGFGGCIFSLGYLTNDLEELNITVLNQSYSIPVENNLIEPKITHITPTTVFDDNLTVEICCDDSDAVIFYTLDGSNPGYSSTRLIYTSPFVVDKSTTVHYTIINMWGNFQKDLMYSIHNGFNVVQDVFVEIPGNSHYYLFDSLINNLGSWSFGQFDVFSEEQLKSARLYTHPFIVREPTAIYHRELSGYWDIGFQGYIAQFTSIVFYGFDFSINYIKNTIVNESDAIWSQYQGDNHNTGVTNMSGPLHNQSSWVNNAILSSGSAVVDGKGHIYVGGDDGYLYCLNNQGLVIWRYGTTSKILCTPTLGSDGNIYFSNWWNSSVYCVSPEGQLVWKYNLGDFNTGTSPVFGLNNNLYILTSNSLYSNMYVFNDGVLVGNYSVPLISGSTPCVSSDGSLYLVSVRHELFCLNWDGSLRFIKLLGNYNTINYIQNAQISISIDSNDTLYVLRGQHNDDGREGYFSQNVLTAYYLNGTKKWSNSLNNHFVSGTPSYYKGALYITANNVKSNINGKMLGGRLLAVNSSNGALLWYSLISASGSTLSSPLISGDEIIYVTSNNCVYAFNITGEKIWEYTMTGQYGNPVIYASPTLASDYTLIVTTNQGIYAFHDVSADFTYNHIEGTELSIQFTDLSTDGSNRYFWTFGDGNYSFEQNPNHTYASEGKYRVVLYVEHNGNVTLARNATINVVYHDIIAPSDVTAYINGNLTYGGNFSETQFITLNATDNWGNVTIYYTLDGSNPVNSSSRKVYAGVFDIEIDTILSCVAVDQAGNWGNVSTFEFIITDAVKVNSTLINEIQELLDNAEPGSKFVFSEDVVGANFIINKPLNLITNNATLTGNGIQPVFTFTQSAEGATINGFTINNNGTVGILIDSTSNITVRNCNLNVSDATGINILNSDAITVKDTSIINALDGIVVNQSSNTNLNKLNIQDSYNNGVWIYQSINTTLSDSLLESNGKDQYESKANHVLVDDSKDTSIYGNTIRHGFFGIHLYHTTDGVIIDNNTIYDGSGDAILLSNTYLNVNITHNLIDGCFNGIDFMGYSENVTIKENTIENLHEHSDDIYEVFYGTPFFLSMMNYIYEVNVDDVDDYFNHRYNGIQVSHPSSNFDEGNTILIDNVVIKLGHRAWESRKYTGYLNTGCEGYGYNLMDGSASYTGQGGATHYREGKVDLVVDRIGDATFRLRLINRLDGHYLSNIPEFDVTFRAGGFLQTVKFINDSAVATFDVASVVSDIEAIISTEIRKSASFTMEITEGYHGSNRKADPGFERGEAYDNPNPVIPSFDEVVKHYTNPTKPDNPVIPSEPEKPDTGYGNGTGNGNGVGSGTGSGKGNGSGSNGLLGNGKMNIQSNNTHDSNSGDSPDLGEAMDRSSEGGSDAGSGETINAYEVSKVINMEKSNLNFVLAVILFAVIVILGYGYRRRKGDGDEF